MPFRLRVEELKQVFKDKKLGGISITDFILAKGVTKFNKGLRTEYLRQQVEMDFSIPSLQAVGTWTPIEVEYLNKAWRNVSKGIVAGSNGKAILVGSDKLLITGTLVKGAKPFTSQPYVYRLVAAEASKLLKSKYSGLRLSNAEVDALDKKLIDKVELTSDELHALAFSRLSGIADDEATERHFTTAAGHLQGHENFRLTAGTRAAVLFSAVGTENIPTGLKEEIDVLIGLDEETINTLINIQSQKIAKTGATPPATVGVGTYKFKQKTTIDISFKNSDKGKAEEKEAAKRLNTQILEIFKRYSKDNEVIDSLLSSSFSPSYITRIENTILGQILGGKSGIVKKITGKPKTKKKGKPIKFSLIDDKVKAKSYTIKATKGKPKRKPLKHVQFDSGIDLFSLQGLINEMLTEQVQQQMADSAATDGRLRYQTGRFAESANLLTLTSTQAGLLAGTYTYKRDPYDVFLPGHKLGTAKRDPRIYVEGAIRNAAISILKRRFNGIALELQ